MDLVIERAGGREIVAERLLDHHARVLGETGIRQALDHRAEQERRDLQVEDGRRRPSARHTLVVSASRSRRTRKTGGRRSDRRRPVDLLPGSHDARARDRVACPASSRRRRRRRSGIEQASPLEPVEDRNVITLARSPVIPKTTKRPPAWCPAGPERVRGRAFDEDVAPVVMPKSPSLVFVQVGPRGGRTLNPDGVTRPQFGSISAGRARACRRPPPGSAVRTLMRAARSCVNPAHVQFTTAFAPQVLTRREQRQMNGSPCERGGLALDRAPSAHLDDRGGAANHDMVPLSS